MHSRQDVVRLNQRPSILPWRWERCRPTRARTEDRIAERCGRGLLHCPYCHGYEIRDQPLGVLGGTPEAVAHAHLVRQWSDDVVYFGNGSTLTAARVIRIVTDPVTRLVIEDDHLTGIELDSGQIVPRTAVFLRIRGR
jgi:thioredoxin reductase